MESGIHPNQKDHGCVTRHGKEVDQHHHAEEKQVCLAVVKEAREDKASGGVVPVLGAQLLLSCPVGTKNQVSSVRDRDKR